MANSWSNFTLLFFLHLFATALKPFYTVDTGIKFTLVQPVVLQFNLYEVHTT